MLKKHGYTLLDYSDPNALTDVYKAAREAGSPSVSPC